MPKPAKRSPETEQVAESRVQGAANASPSSESIMEALKSALSRTKPMPPGMPFRLEVEAVYPPGLSSVFFQQALEQQWITAHLPSRQISLLVDLATEVFGDFEVAASWLKTPNLATDNKPPVELLGTPQGYERVKILLLRIDYGVLA